MFLWLAVGGLLAFFGARAGALLVLFLAATTQWEFYRLLEKSGLRPFRKIGVLLGVLFLAAAYAMPAAEGTLLIQIGFDGLLAIAAVVIAVAAILLRPPDRIRAMLSTAAGFIYVPFLLHFFLRILHIAPDEKTGLILAFWVVMLVKFADIGAYLTGSVVGRTKLAPDLSPGKTWEGVGGGLAISALVSAGYIWFFRDQAYFPVALTPATAAWAALPIAALSVISDLVESAVKRSANAKDSGRTIPGIGGSFDLTDSLILSVPVAYLFLLFLTTTAGH